MMKFLLGWLVASEAWEDAREAKRDAKDAAELARETDEVERRHQEEVAADLTAMTSAAYKAVNALDAGEPDKARAILAQAIKAR